jgi:ferredoxin
MDYKNVKIYFLSGTGNSYRVAVWLQEECRRRNIAAELIPIDLADPKKEIDASPETLVAFAYPAHGLLPPWSAIKFLFKMPVKRRTHFFTIATRGGIRLSWFFIPGIAGVASMLPSLLLPFKGYNMRGSLSFDMPVNMTSLHGNLGKKNIQRLKDSAKRKARRFYPRLLGGKSVWWTLNNLWEYFWGLLLLYFFPLFPPLYLIIGRFFMGKLQFANHRCIGCGACAKACPNDAIIMKGPRNSRRGDGDRKKDIILKPPRPYWRYNCEDCLRCLNFCRQKAVETGHSWGVILGFISSFSIAAYVFRFVSGFYPQIVGYKNYFTVQLVNALYVYPSVILAYFIFSKLLRIRAVNKFFTYTTLTHYFRRYHEPETKLSDLLRRK